VEPDDAINRGMGIEEKMFASDTDRDESPIRKKSSAPASARITRIFSNSDTRRIFKRSPP
jgi:hypothetical protein